VAPVAPIDVIVTSSRAACPVSSFSLLSRSTFAATDVSATPKFVAGAVTHPCTSDVTSSVTYSPAVVAAAAKLPAALPSDGAVAYVTVPSLHAEVTGTRFTVPPAFTRFTKTVSVARCTCPAVSPPGSVLRSNCSSAVLPLPTYRLESAPKFVVARAELTCASPDSVTSVARAAGHASPANTHTIHHRLIHHWLFNHRLADHRFITRRFIQAAIKSRLLAVQQQCETR
jgi:hypothetical protein